jgi:hypothetical protein
MPAKCRGQLERPSLVRFERGRRDEHAARRDAQEYSAKKLRKPFGVRALLEKKSHRHSVSARGLTHCSQVPTPRLEPGS